MKVALFPIFFSLAAFMVVVLGGCGSRTALVKNQPVGKSTFAEAIQTSDTVQAKKNSPPKITSYPPLPTDDNGPRVRGFIREYGYKQRDTMKGYLAAADEYLPMVRAIAKESGLPEDIAYLVMLESGANPEARSPANALGMWQFMPDTARSYGLRVDSWVDERLDPEASTKAAMLYLKDLYGMFGCWRLALSAYNSGENKLNKVLCQEDANQYEEICSSPRLKRETREFWPRFQAIARIARSPEKYGFAALNLKPHTKKHALVTVEGCYSLETLAKLAEAPINELADLNPALIRGKTPPNGAPCSLRVPIGKHELLVAKLKDVPEDSAKEHIIHVVHKGDSLKKILAHYKITKSQLANSNPDVNLRRALRRGDKIVIPVEKKKSEQKSREKSHLSLLK